MVSSCRTTSERVPPVGSEFTLIWTIVNPMAFFKHTQSAPVEEATDTSSQVALPLAAPETKDGVRDFWQHWDYLLGMVPELAEFGVPVLDAIDLTLNESILAEQDMTPDFRAGDVVIDKGTKVVPRMLGLLTGMGIRKVMARPSPRVLVIALSEAAVPASYLVTAQAQEVGAQAHRLEYITTAPDQVVGSILEQLVRADLIITVGGMGEAGFDLKKVADQIGPCDFTPVAITPGSNHGFALAEQKVPLLALPADVYATFVLMKLLAEPMIAKLMGANTDPAISSAYLAQPLRITPKILTCVPAMVSDARMTITGRPVGLAGLNMIYRANALALLTTDDGLVDVNSEAFYLPLA